MIYKEIDYGSYESPNSKIPGMISEEVIASSGDGSWNGSIGPGTDWDNDDDDHGLE